MTRLGETLHRLGLYAHTTSGRYVDDRPVRLYARCELGGPRTNFIHVEAGRVALGWIRR